MNILQRSLKVKAYRKLLENFNSLVLFYQNDLSAALTELIVELRLWYS